MSDNGHGFRSAAAKIWSLCNVLRGDGVGYNQYISELTYLLFLKIAEENGSEATLPLGYRWADLYGFDGENLLGHYQELLTHLGASAESDLVREIYSFPTTVFSHSENLRVVLDGLNSLNWKGFSGDSLGKIYEALLAKNSEDARSGAGQYFTPRSLVDAMVAVSRPALGEVIQDPSCGTGGFLISADTFLRAENSPDQYLKNPPRYVGMEIEKGTHRLCLMNVFLHGLDASISLGDALSKDSNPLPPADLILANPPFGSKFASARPKRVEFAFATSNKQLEFLQHIYHGLKSGGRAAVVLPDNVLFDGGTGRQIRRELMETCSLHTILRLPAGIFYAQGVKTSVLFFTKGAPTTETWIYDLRSGAPRFGKRILLSHDFFADFVESFGDWPDHKESSSRAPSGRFRRFSRDELTENEDNLDVRWLSSEPGDEDIQRASPDELSALLLSELRDVIAEVELLHARLSEIKQ